MSLVFTLLILGFIGTLGARQPDIDINRIKRIPKGTSNTLYGPSSIHNRRQFNTNHRRYDYDNHSSRNGKLRTPMHLLHDTSSPSETKANQIHQPREDPRLFYQSDAYTKETSGKNLNNEVSSVFLGRGEVRGGVDTHRSLPILWKDNSLNSINNDICVRCPQDRTLITRTGLDRALLRYPQLMTCSGFKAPKATRFIHMYGPKFGSLLKEGSHVVVGRITHKGENLQTCKMQIHVLIQTCPVPKHLVPHCGEDNKTCGFSCRNSKAEIRGHKTLTCRDDNKWSGRLPACSVRAWCSPPPQPEHGEVACQGTMAPNGWGLAEGSRCRANCAPGWQWTPRAAAVCRRGLWTRELICQPQRT